MSGEIRTQGSEIWILDSTQSPPALVKIGNVVQYGDFGPQADDIDTTNLESTAVEKVAGLPDNGDATLNINFADIASHRLINENTGNGIRFKFFIGYSDGTADPTTDGTTITPGASRTGDAFEASIKSFRKSVNKNDVIRAVVALAISGSITTTWKSGL
jgi:hypothetical protein